MKINYYLKEKNSNTETNIILYFNYNGKRLRYSSGIKTPLKQWNEKKQYIYSVGKHATENNEFLRSLKTELEAEYKKQISKGKILEPEYFRSFLDKKFKAKYKKSESDLFMLLDELIEVKKKTCSASTVEKYNIIRKQLKEIEEYYKFELNIHSFSNGFYQDFIDYFVFERGQQNSTIKDNAVKKINAFLNWLVNEGHIEKNEFKGIRFPYKINPADTISLTEQELNTIYNLDLSANTKLKQVRDVFCLECYTGLRYSDAKKVNKSNISENTIKIFTKKTTDSLNIPLREEALKILNSYFENNLTLPAISTQKMNDYLKELGKLCEFNDTIPILRISGNTKTELVKNKYELLSTHTGRRTFVTLSYQRGIPDFILMQITGHKSIETFRKYFRIKDIDAKNTFLEAWATIQTKFSTSEIIKNLIIKDVSLETISFALGVDINEIKKLVL